MIEPALTPEEWENPSDAFGHGYLDLEFGSVDVSLGMYGPKTQTQERHALAALLLNGQPFGFTWRDVDNIEDVAPDLAARIAALLPPRDVPGSVPTSDDISDGAENIE